MHYEYRNIILAQEGPQDPSILRIFNFSDVHPRTYPSPFIFTLRKRKAILREYRKEVTKNHNFLKSEDGLGSRNF